MLIRLLEVNVSDHWDLIKKGIEEALPPVVGESPDKMNNILRAMLIGAMQVWVSTGEDGLVNAIVTTSITEDANSETKCLLIYTVSAIKKTDAQSWINGLATLRKFAKARGCSRVIAYTNDEKVLAISNKMGAETYTFLSFELD
jgi:hypothetical protein